MNFLKTVKSSLTTPQFSGGDGYITREGWDTNLCHRIPQATSLNITEIDTDKDNQENLPGLSVNDVSANDWVVLIEDPTVIHYV